MRTEKLAWLVLPATLFVMAGFVTTGCAQQKMRPDFGNSTLNNVSVQTVNPDAAAQAQAGNTVDGQKAEKALQRYRADAGQASRGKILSELGN